MKSKLPKQLFARLEEESNGEFYVLAWEAPEDAIDGDGPTEIGIYRLERTVRLKKVVEGLDAV